MAPVSSSLDALIHHQSRHHNITPCTTIPLGIAIMTTIAFIWLISSAVFLVLGEDKNLYFTKKSPLLYRIITRILVCLMLPPKYLFPFIYRPIVGKFRPRSIGPLLPLYNEHEILEPVPRVSELAPLLPKYEKVNNGYSGCYLLPRQSDITKDPLLVQLQLQHQQPELKVQENRDKIVKDIVQQVKITTQKRKEATRKTVQQMVYEQPNLRVERRIELMPNRNGQGGTREEWKNYYDWIDRLDVVEEEEEKVDH
ncbi:hypothetical protein QBC38DRAFT_461334 [Podospora fimiseda]|uniref:Uncharacterized protein n=1 Tax=Podospora fimiseda TaxID=252190 RepID=A0AAN6YLQ4_9PEZI|nr:hypothetical protein QBC38DRAFT_461334 [Podospora fimiseda]